MDYQKIYDNLIKKRLENPPTEKFERHHIVPKSLGGSNKKENIVKLTYREHYIAHLLLCKIYKPKGGVEYKKMLFALNRMRTGRDGSQVKNSRMFEYFCGDYIKVLSETMSKAQSGERNSNYGMSWYYHPELKINKKFKNDGIIPDGFIKICIPKHKIQTVITITDDDGNITIKDQRHCEDCGILFVCGPKSLARFCDSCRSYNCSRKLESDAGELYNEWLSTDLTVNQFAKLKGVSGARIYHLWNEAKIDYKEESKRRGLIFCANQRKIKKGNTN